MKNKSKKQSTAFAVPEAFMKRKMKNKSKKQSTAFAVPEVPVKRN